jgi:hypothetical protein
MTEKGEEFYKQLEKTWKQMADAVNHLTQPIINP